MTVTARSSISYSHTLSSSDIRIPLLFCFLYLSTTIYISTSKRIGHPLLVNIPGTMQWLLWVSASQ